MTNSRFHLQSHVDALYADPPRKLAFQAKTAAEFAVWQAELRARISDLLRITGRTLPLSPPVEHLQTTDYGDYSQEKLALEVGEGVFAPIYLLIPRTPPPYRPVLAFPGHGEGTVQAILGHYPDEETAQIKIASDENYAQVLAQAGYLVCAVEQRGFGERVTNQTQPELSMVSCHHLAFEYLLHGRVLLGERVWDGMIALSYLLNRDDLVKGEVGCTGLSGGGTAALWLSALDERITTIVVAGYLCSFKHSILGMHHCECNYVPGILDYCEMGDLAALLAPRAFRAIAGERDPIFPVEYTRQQFATVQRAYDLLGVSSRCSLTIHPGEHRYDSGMALEWFLQEMSLSK